jgi:hypothetical protein
VGALSRKCCEYIAGCTAKRLRLPC